MAAIAIIAFPASYMASVGAMCDAHARLGEIYENNILLGAYAKLNTELILATIQEGPLILAGGHRWPSDQYFEKIRPPRAIFLPSFQLPDHWTYEDWTAAYSHFHTWLRGMTEQGVFIGACGASVLHLAAVEYFEIDSLSAHPSLKERFHRWYPNAAMAPLDDIQISNRCVTCAYDSDAMALAVRLLGEVFSPAVGRGLALRSLASGPHNAYPKVADALVEQAQIMIRDRFTHNLQVADIAKKFNISHQSLIRRFRKEIGVTPKRYIQSVRVESAAIMLRETRRSVAEIAQLVGYVDVPSFRRAFVEVSGMSPSHYRHQPISKD